MEHFVDWRVNTGASAEKFHKATLWQGEHVMIGLNCLEPNQTQAVHAHQSADKFYLVLEGRGTFTVGDEQRDADAGILVIAQTGEPHGGSNTGSRRLCLSAAFDSVIDAKLC